MKKLFLILCLLMPTPAVRAQDFTPVDILITKFQSPKGKSVDVGAKAASTLGLQMWRTYSTQTRKKTEFDNASFIFDFDHRPKNFEDVEALARRRKKNTNLVLWGKASEYANAIVVEANLSVRKGAGKNRLGANIWSVVIPTGKNSHTIAVDVPQSEYEFAPIVLDPRLIVKFEREALNLMRGDSRYFAVPERLNIGIYSMRSTLSELKGVFGADDIRAISHEADWSYVEVEGKGTGWVYLPELSQKPSEVVNFSSGIIRAFRNDLRGAITLFEAVLKNDDAPTAIKIDSYLYMAMAYDRLGEEAKSFSMVAEAYKLNPYCKATTQYLCMSYLSKLARLLSQDKETTEAGKIAASVREVLSKNRVLFAEDDTWIRQVQQVLAELAA